MNITLRRAAEKALSVIEWMNSNGPTCCEAGYTRQHADAEDAEAALRAALAEPVQETVAWMHPEDGRVIPDSTMRTALRDGGASLSSVSGFTVALGVIRKRHAALAEKAQEPVQERSAAE